mgnify:CR=1 FL=1
MTNTNEAESALLDEVLPEQDSSISYLEVVRDDYPEPDAYVEDNAIRRFVNLVLFQSAQDNASDIYFELNDRQFKIRYKVDGELFEMAPPPRRLFEPVGEELRCMFGLAENKAKPRTFKQWLRRAEPGIEVVPTGDYSQDHIVDTILKSGGRDFVLNLTRLPTTTGENYHVELLTPTPRELNPSIEELIEYKDSGLILLSSPDGNGKTTTGHQILEHLSRPNNVVVAIERKASYPIGGVSTIRTSPERTDYAETLRAVRFYQPDIVFFDDLSDEQSAKEVLHYAKNGKLAIAAVTAKSAAGSLEYLMALNKDVAGMTDDISGLVSQRLLKVVHGECEGNGCVGCHDSGYSGRIAAYDVIGQNGDLQKYSEALKSGKLKDFAHSLTMSTSMRKLVEDGTTSKAEIDKQFRI